MRCPKCKADGVVLVITTRLYNSVPIVVSQTRCISCHWSYDGDLHKRFFCKGCGRLTGSRSGLCGVCSGTGKRSHYD